MTYSKKKLFSALVVLSVLLNVFFIGGAASLLLRPHFPPMPPSPVTEMRRAALALPEESRQKVEAILTKHQDGIERRFEDMRNVFPRMFEILTADTFDQKAFNDLRRHMADTDTATHTEMDSAILEIVHALPDDERIDFFRKAAPPRPPFMRPTEK